jgi:hypothetical protein
MHPPSPGNFQHRRRGSRGVGNLREARLSIAFKAGRNAFLPHLPVHREAIKNRPAVETV